MIAAMKLLQMLTTGIGMFIVPSLIAAFLFHHCSMQNILEWNEMLNRN